MCYSGPATNLSESVVTLVIMVPYYLNIFLGEHYTYLFLMEKIYHCITLDVCASGPAVSLSEPVVNFMQINAGEVATKPIDLINNSDTEATFQV